MFFLLLFIEGLWFSRFFFGDKIQDKEHKYEKQKRLSVCKYNEKTKKLQIFKNEETKFMLKNYS